MTTMAAIYARLSVDRDGTKVGIDTQLQDSRKLALERGWKVVAEYVDRNLSAADRLVKRPEYDRMVQDFEAGRFDALVCWDLDRLTRQPRQLEDWIDASKDRRFTIITANGEADLSTDSGQLFARIKAAVAKSEADRASARQKRNKQHRRENGLWHGGTPPYGYRAESGALVPEPAEVERIHEVARRMLDDRESMHSIVTDWNNRGVQTRRGKHWRQANLRSIMLNRSMLGETMPGVRGWEPIIDQRTFDRMNALLTEPGRKVVHSPGVRGGKYTMGGGLSVCAACKKPLITHRKPSPNVKTTTLACLARVHGPSEEHPRIKRVRGGKEVWQDTGRVSIAHDPLEEHVFDQVIARLKATPRFIQRMTEHDPELDSRLDELEQSRRDLRARKDRAKEMRLDGDLTRDEYRVEAEKVDTLLDKLDLEYSGLLRVPVSMDDFDVEKGVDWQAWTPGKRRTFLRLFIDRVEVYPFPEGAVRTRPRFRNEDPAHYAQEKRRLVREATATRTTIVWRKSR